MMEAFSWSELTRRGDEVREAAIRGAVRIEERGRSRWVLMTRSEYQWLTQGHGEFKVSEAPPPLRELLAAGIEDILRDAPANDAGDCGDAAFNCLW